MDRESRRHLDEFRREAGRSRTTLIDEFVEGELSRADFIRRATVFGLSASVIGTVLGRWARPRLPSPGPEAGRAGGASGLRSSRRRRTGSIRTRTRNRGRSTWRYRRRVPDPCSAQPLPEAGAGNEVERKQGRHGLDVQASLGREVPARQEMDADDVVATFKRWSPIQARRRNQRSRRALGRRRAQGRRPDGRVPSGHPDASFPYLTSSTTYQAIILPANYQNGTLRQDRRRRPRVQARFVHAGRRREVRPLRGLVGRDGAARRRRRHVLL